MPDSKDRSDSGASPTTARPAGSIGKKDTGRKKPAVLSEEEAHIGATENQVTPTMPPSPSDDEPKQG